MEQKCELAERELTEMKDEIQRMKEDSEQTLQNLEVWLSRTLMIQGVKESCYFSHLFQGAIPEAVRQACLVRAVHSRALL